MTTLKVNQLSIQCPGDSFSPAKIFLYSLFFRGNKKFSWRMPLSLQRFSPLVPELLAADGMGFWDFDLCFTLSRSSRVLLCLKSRNDIIKLYPHPFKFGSIIVKERILAHRNIVNPKSKSPCPPKPPSPTKSLKKEKKEGFGLRAYTKISWATTPTSSHFSYWFYF